MQPTPSPSPEPTPAPAGAAPPAAPYEPIVELIRTQRQNAGYALTVLAAVFLVAAVMMVVKGQRPAGATTTATDKDKGKDAEDPFKALPADGAELTQSNRSDYWVGALGMALGLVVTGSGAAYLIVGLPRPTEAGQRREARVLVLLVGGLLGAFLILIGAWFFIRWSDSLVKWLDKGDIREAKYALYPILMVALGGGLMMLAIQPARAEERNNTTIRRLVYGSNFGLTILILFVVLVIANAVVAMRVPNRLDTTSTGFFSLNEQTKQLIEGLDTPIHAYAIFQEGGDPVADDVKRLLNSAQDVNPSKFQVRFLSPALNRDEISKLRANYPMAEMSREGVLLVAGEEGATARNRHSFIRSDEFGSQTEGPDGRPVASFTGEQKLLRELMFLAENKNRPKVYFTQSSGELALSPAGGRADPRRSATALKSYLEKNYFDVAPLTFDVGAPAKVPDDASVVVVADPSAPLPPNAVEAIRKFMSEPRPDGKKGKLVVLAGGAQRGADEKPLKLGIEPTLGAFGVQLSDRFLYAVPSERADPRDRDQGARVMLAVINPEAVEARNPVALGFANVERLPLLDCRELSVVRAPTYQTVTLLSSMPGRPTWTEPVYSPSPLKTWIEFDEQLQRIVQSKMSPEQMQKQVDELVAQKQISRRSHDLAVFVSEGQGPAQTARLAVFGCGWFVSDDAAGRAQGQSTSTWLELMGATLDWIRDRPPLPPVGEKQYTSYMLKPGYDSSRLIYVPLGLGLLTVLGLGAGVWVVRRK
ncbi:MAG: Gldg family protein [Planctomycetes bacterium]|nr:Gldg family protein [Planctomycetota bacterium]